MAGIRQRPIYILKLGLHTVRHMQFVYFGIRVRDLKRSIRFYSRVLGLKQVHKGTMGHGGVFVHLKKTGSSQRLELNYYPPGNRFYEKYRTGTEMDHIGFWVEDVDRTYARAISRGAKRAAAPFSNNRERLAYVKDPDGIWIEFFGKDKSKS
jgi:lactoylglutathione lyase